MKMLDKRELQQITFNHSSDIDFRNFTSLYKKCIKKPFSFLVIDATLASDDLPCFRKNFLETTWKLTMTIDDKNRDEKLFYDINRSSKNISIIAR